MTSSGVSIWVWNDVKLASYLMYIVVLIFYVYLILRMQTVGAPITGVALGALVLLAGVAVLAFLREHPTRTRFAEGGLKIDMGILGGTHRFLTLRPNEVLELTATHSGPIWALKLRTMGKRYSWVVSKGFANVFQKHIH